MGKNMKSYLMAMFFITFFGLSDAIAQNVTQMVEAPNSGPAPAAAPVVLENTLVKIEVIGLRGNFFKPITPPPKVRGKIGSFIDTATEITKNAYFQRQRFNETGQPIEIDQNHI